MKTYISQSRSILRCANPKANHRPSFCVASLSNQISREYTSTSSHASSLLLSRSSVNKNDKMANHPFFIRSHSLYHSFGFSFLTANQNKIKDRTIMSKFPCPSLFAVSYSYSTSSSGHAEATEATNTADTAEQESRSKMKSRSEEVSNPYILYDENGEILKIKHPRGALVGRVVSTKMNKSIAVRVTRLKLITPMMVKKNTFKKFIVHDEEEICREGDIVRIKPCVKISKRKAYTLHEVIKQNPLLSDYSEGSEETGEAKGKKYDVLIEKMNAIQEKAEERVFLNRY